MRPAPRHSLRIPLCPARATTSGAARATDGAGFFFTDQFFFFARGIMCKSETRGFIFATTGEKYTNAARKAARNLRQAMPEAQIDLFTNQKIEDAVFDRIHPIKTDFFRPKMEAMLNSRFDRTVCLDSDVVVLCDVTEMFDILDNTDLAIAHGRVRDKKFMHDDTVPRAFPVLNSGVVAYRRTRQVHGLLHEWLKKMREADAEVDQGWLRDSMYHRRKSFVALPIEYNVVELQRLSYWPPSNGAPRILHIHPLNDAADDPLTPFDVERFLSPRHWGRLKALIEADRHWPKSRRPVSPRRRRPFLQRLDDTLFRWGI